MNDKLNALCHVRDAIVLEIGSLEDLHREYSFKHDPRQWEVLPKLTVKYSQLIQNQAEIEALFAPEPKKSFLKKLFKRKN